MAAPSASRRVIRSRRQPDFRLSAAASSTAAVRNRVAIPSIGGIFASTTTRMAR